MTVDSQSLSRRGLTLIELMVVVALVATLAALAAPSFKRLIDMQRLRSISAALVTDLQLARAEAASRNERVFVRFDKTGGSLTCYVLLSGDTTKCNCKNQPGVNVCAVGAREIRTVQVERSQGIKVEVSDPQTIDTIGFEPATGRLLAVILDVPQPATVPFLVDSMLADVGGLRVALEVTGRPSTCSPSGRIGGVTACAAP